MQCITVTILKHKWILFWRETTTFDLRDLHKAPKYPGEHPFKQVPFMRLQSSKSTQLPHFSSQFCPYVPFSHASKYLKCPHECIFSVLFLWIYMTEKNNLFTTGSYTHTCTCCWIITYIHDLHNSPVKPGSHPFKHVPFVWKQEFLSMQWPHVLLQSFP